MAILTDDIPFSASFEIINESDKPLPRGILGRGRGPIGITESENRNGRVYENQFWRNILSREDIQEAINDRAMIGCADHPDSFTPPVAAISHVMTKSWLDENNNALMAEFDILDTPMGQIVMTLFDAKVKIGASTRAIGQTVVKNGKSLVQEKGYKWGGFDFVTEPSAQNAYPQAIREEIEKIIRESSYESIYSGSPESFETTKKLYESVLTNIGCNTSLLLEKAPDPSKQVKNTEMQISLLETANKALMGEAKHVNETLKETEEKLAAISKDSELVVADKHALHTENEKLKKQLSELTDRMKVLADSFLSSARTTTVQPANENNATIVVDDDEDASYDAQISSLTDNVKKLEGQNSSLANEVSELKLKLKEAESTKGKEVVKLTESISQSNKTISDLSKLNESYDEAILLLQGEVKALSEELDLCRSRASILRVEKPKPVVESAPVKQRAQRSFSLPPKPSKVNEASLAASVQNHPALNEGAPEAKNKAVTSNNVSQIFTIVKRG